MELKTKPDAVAGSALVLVVDDDSQIRQMIQWTLEDEGLPVATAADGRQALEQVRRHKPDLMILDINMPFMDGYMVAAALRATYGDEIPIITLTAAGQVADKARAVGAVDYLSKPFDLDDLLHSVWRALGAA
jgi:CheY-like chemotaxis protein